MPFLGVNELLETDAPLEVSLSTVKLLMSADRYNIQTQIDPSTHIDKCVYKMHIIV